VAVVKDRSGMQITKGAFASIPALSVMLAKELFFFAEVRLPAE
jgi:hypothetical protein